MPPFNPPTAEQIAVTRARIETDLAHALVRMAKRPRLTAESYALRFKHTTDRLIRENAARQGERV